MYNCFILHLHKIPLIPFNLLQNDKNGKHIQKIQT